MLATESRTDEDSSSSSSSFTLPPSRVIRTSSVVSLDATVNNLSRKRRAPRAQLSRINLGSANTDSTTAGSENLTNTSNSASEDESNNAEETDKRIRLSSSSSATSQSSIDGSSSRSSSSSPSPDVCYDIVDLECGGQNTPSVKSLPQRKETIIGDGEFELIGDGNPCNAVHILSQTVHHCQIFKQDEYNRFMAVAERLEKARDILFDDEECELRRLLLPNETRVIRGEHTGLYYVISPAVKDSLHTLLKINPNNRKTFLCEERGRRIFVQIVRLVSYCHKIGIYFCDFKLQKIVLCDSTTDRIRFLFAPQDLFVAPNLSDDQLKLEKGCPAYTTPEMFPPRQSKCHTYRAGPADMWSLGVLLYFLLKGQPPFVARNPGDLFRLIRMCKYSYDPTDNISLPVRLLISSLLKINPNDRPLPDEILAFDWLRDTSDNYSEYQNSVSIVQPYSGNVRSQAQSRAMGHVDRAVPVIGVEALSS